MPEDGSVRPKLYTYRYGVSGDEHLPKLEPVVFEIATRRKVRLATEPLICLARTWVEKRDAWWSADSRTIYYLNRARFAKSIGLHRADPLTGAVHEVLREESDAVVQVNASNVLDNPVVETLTNGDIVWYSERDGWGH